MSIHSCPRHPELSEVLKAGHWPGACDPNLREHVSHCQRCSDLVLLTEAFKAARADAVAHTHLHHPGPLWWRAQLRRRNQALQQLSKPTHFVGRFALLSALLVTTGFLIGQRRGVAGWLDWLGAVPRSDSFNMGALWSAASNWSLLLLISCLGSLILFAAIALYLSSDRN